MIGSAARLRALDLALARIAGALARDRGDSGSLDAALRDLETPRVPGPDAGAQVVLGGLVCARALVALQAPDRPFDLTAVDAAFPRVEDSILPLCAWVVTGPAAVVAVLPVLDQMRVDVEDVVHCYEALLSRRHGEQRRKLGVFHTPTEVAAHLVERVDRALQALGFSHGLSDARSYRQCGIAPPPMVGADAPVVRVMEPAAGVGVFLRELLRHAHRQHARGLGPEPADDFAGHLERDLLPRLSAYELMPSAAILCRMHLSVVLAQLGCPPALARRLTLHTGNFLEQVVEEGAGLGGVSVIIGNPPYARSSENRGERVTRLLEPYKRGLREERNLQPLSDDYIKFMRATEVVLQGAPLGVLGLVTNHSFLRGRLHRTMRRSLQQTFCHIDVLDLHGNSKVRAPGPRDENVFAIAQGVAVSTLVRKPGVEEPTVYYAELRGRRRDKLARLSEGRVPAPRRLERQPLDSFAPVEEVPAEYARFVPLPELFDYHSVGGKPGDDTVLVGFERDELLRKLEQRSSELSGGVQPRTEAARKLAQRPSDKPFAPESVIPYAYRPFDDRLAYYDPDIWTRPLRDLRRMVDGEPILLTTRIVKDSHFAHVFSTRRFPDVIALSTTSSVNCYAFPSGRMRTERLCQISGLTLSQAEAFAYVYATLHSPTYRHRYVGGLRNDFPRVPLCRDPALLAALVARGGSLLRAHLREGESCGRRPHFIDGGDREVREAVLHADAEDSARVSVNAVSRFVDLPADCWEFRIGGYQVCRKWLSDRKRAQRVLSDRDVRDYCDMVARIDETLQLQRDIDALVDERGGWPRAFG